MDTTQTFPHPLFRITTTAWPRSAKRILAFLVLSLALHSLLFAILPGLELASSNDAPSMRMLVTLTLGPSSPHEQSQPNRPARTEHGKVTQLSHTAPAPTSGHNAAQSRTQRNLAARPPATRARSKLPSRHNSSPRRPRLQNTVTAISAPQLQESHNVATGPAPAPVSTPAPDPAAVAALLRRALQQHFYYPTLALQNSWEGKVVLGMRVTASGQVGDARVVRASGFRILDRAARHAANNIGSLPAARHLLAGQSLTFRVPVVYRLQHRR